MSELSPYRSEERILRQLGRRGLAERGGINRVYVYAV